MNLQKIQKKHHLHLLLTTNFTKLTEIQEKINKVKEKIESINIQLQKAKEDEDKKISLFKEEIKKTSMKLIDYKLDVCKKSFEENFLFDVSEKIKEKWRNL